MSSLRSDRCLGKAVLSTLLLSALAACGGGGGNSNDNGGSGNGGGTVPPPTPAMSRLTLTGTVTDAPIASAVVTATVGSQTFTATADANGNYRLELSVAESATGGFITLTAKGAGPQSYVEFTSLLGTFQALKTQAGSDEVLSSGENFATQITNVSTAVAVLLQQANGGQPVASQTLLDTLTPTLNAQQLLDLATAIKLLVDEATEYPLPSGQTSLQTLLADNAVREQFVTDFYDQDPTTFNNTRNAIVSDTTLTQPVTTATLPPTLTAVVLDHGGPTYFHTDRAVSYSFNADGTGTASTGSWHRNMTWSISGASVEIAYEQPLELSGWEWAVCPDDGFGYEPAEYEVYYRTDGAKLTFFDKHLLAITETRDILGRDCGIVPDAPEIVTMARTILDDDDFQPIDIAELRDSTRTLWVYSDAFDDQYVFPNFMPDLAQLNADGTGTTHTYGKPFTWSLDASGRVINVSFTDDGITAKFRSIRELDSVATDVLYEFTLPGGRRVDAGPSLRTDPQQQLAFTSDNVLGRHYTFGINDPPFVPGSKGTRLRFDANGLGTRETEIIDQDGNVTVRDSSSENRAYYGFHWNIDGEDLMLEYTSNDAGERNCDPYTTSPCDLTEEARVILLATEGTRTYWFESWRTGIPYLYQGFAPHTYLRYYDYEPFGAPAGVSNAVRRDSHIARGAYHKLRN